jgi:hypothetical protein
MCDKNLDKSLEAVGSSNGGFEYPHYEVIS